jgi:hypothetical protein
MVVVVGGGGGKEKDFWMQDRQMGDLESLIGWVTEGVAIHWVEL